MWTIGQKKEFGTYNANMIFDENGDSILMVYGIQQNTMLEDLKNRDADGLAIARQVVNDHNNIAALREAGEKMERALQDVLHDRPSAHTDNVWENVNAALEAWEAANK